MTPPEKAQTGKMSDMARLYVVSGPSGVGKSTIAHAILDKFKDSIIYSISMTTRHIREGELDGREYIFTTVAEFEKLIAEGAFIEHAKVHDNYYGTLRSQIESALAKGINVLLDIDTKGAQNIKKNYHDAVLIFIAPPSIEELRQRLLKRHTDSVEVIEKRIHNAIQEIEMSTTYDYIVKNIDLEQAVGECEGIIEDHMNNASARA